MTTTTGRLEWGCKTAFFSWVEIFLPFLYNYSLLKVQSSQLKSLIFFLVRCALADPFSVDRHQFPHRLNTNLTVCMTVAARFFLFIYFFLNHYNGACWNSKFPLCTLWLETRGIRSVWEMSQIHVPSGELCHAKICIGGCDYCACLPLWKPKRSISSLKCSLKCISPV